MYAYSWCFNTKTRTTNHWMWVYFVGQSHMAGWAKTDTIWYDHFWWGSIHRFPDRYVCAFVYWMILDGTILELCLFTFIMICFCYSYSECEMRWIDEVGVGQWAMFRDAIGTPRKLTSIDSSHVQGYCFWLVRIQVSALKAIFYFLHPDSEDEFPSFSAIEELFESPSWHQQLRCILAIFDVVGQYPHGKSGSSPISLVS